MAKYVFRIAVITWFCLAAHTSHAQRPAGLSPAIGEVIEVASNFMNNSVYDSAQYVISAAFTNSQLKISNYDLYFLHSYEAEIMYYNALFEQGLNTAMRAYEIAQGLGNDTLIGSSENFIGLFEMNLGRNEQAVEHFKRAIALIPIDSKQEYLSFRYHANANLGECFIKLNKPDSIISYSLASLEEARLRGKPRGIALAYLNLAEASFMKHQIDSSASCAGRAMQVVEQTVHRDIVQMLCVMNMRIADARGSEADVKQWLDRGLRENADPLNTDFSRIYFTEKAIGFCIQYSWLERGRELMSELNQLERAVSGKQQSQRIAILKDYYEKNQRLLLSDQVAQAQAESLRQRTIITVALAALVVSLFAILFVLRRSSRQKARIKELQFSDELRRKESELELKATRQRMEALYLERNRIASDLHDDIGASLSSIRIYGSAASNQFDEKPEEVRSLLQKINGTTTGIMDRMSDIVWSIHPGNDSAESIVLRMKTAVSELFDAQGIETRFKVSNDLDRWVPTVMAKRNLYLIFKEAVNNISKYSKATSVEVELRLQGREFVMLIQDNGVGFDLAAMQSGNGLRTMRERASALLGKLTVESVHGAGTKLILTTDITNISDSITDLL